MFVYFLSATCSSPLYSVRIIKESPWQEFDDIDRCCSGFLITNTNTTTCLENGEWELDTLQILNCDYEGQSKFWVCSEYHRGAHMSVNMATDMICDCFDAHALWLGMIILILTPRLLLSLRAYLGFINSLNHHSILVCPLPWPCIMEFQSVDVAASIQLFLSPCWPKLITLWLILDRLISLLVLNLQG